MHNNYIDLAGEFTGKGNTESKRIFLVATATGASASEIVIRYLNQTNCYRKAMRAREFHSRGNGDSQV